MAKKTDTKVSTKTAEQSPKTLAQLRADLLLAQKGLYEGTLQNPHAIKSIKKDIARALTKINATSAESSTEVTAEAVEKGSK